MFGKKLADASEALIAEGWKWAEPINDSYIGWYQIDDMKLARIYAESGQLSEDQIEEFDTLEELANDETLDDDGKAKLAALQSILDGAFTDEQKAHAGVLVYVDGRGEVQCETGLIRSTDKKTAIEAGVLAKSNHAGSTGTKSAISNKLRVDLDRIATGARQNAALRDPDLLLALLAFQLSGKSGYTNVLGLRETEVPNVPTTEMAGYALDERLTKATRPAKFGSDMGRVFRAYKAKRPEFIKEEVTRHLASLLMVDEDLGEMIDKVVKTDIRENFTPTAENFFYRVSGPYLVNLWSELLDLPEDHPTATSFAKLKKSEKANKMEALFGDPEMHKAHNVTDAQAKRIDAWLPEGMV